MAENRRHKKYPSGIAYALKETEDCRAMAEYQLDMKRDLMANSLKGLWDMMKNVGMTDVPLHLNEGGAMFLFSSLNDYMDGEMFTAFTGESEGDSFAVLMSVFAVKNGIDEDDGIELKAETTFLKEKPDGSTYVLTTDGWKYCPDD